MNELACGGHDRLVRIGERVGEERGMSCE